MVAIILAVARPLKAPLSFFQLSYHFILEAFPDSSS